MPLTHDDVVRILKIIDESDYDEVHIEMGDVKLHLRKGADNEAVPIERPAATRAPQPSLTETPRTESAAVSAPPKKAAPDEPVAEGLVAIRAPMLGTFYRAPSPGEKPFVEVGDKVQPDSTVCLVEVMKLFHSVKAGAAGTVTKILVENGSMVEYGQVLLLIEQEAVGGGK